LFCSPLICCILCSAVHKNMRGWWSQYFRRVECYANQLTPHKRQPLIPHRQKPSLPHTHLLQHYTTLIHSPKFHVSPPSLLPLSTEFPKPRVFKQGSPTALYNKPSLLPHEQSTSIEQTTIDASYLSHPPDQHARSYQLHGFVPHAAASNLRYPPLPFYPHI
jgi:hypothetical protein